MSLCRNDPFRLVGGLIPRREDSFFVHVRISLRIADKPIFCDEARYTGSNLAASGVPRIILALPVVVPAVGLFGTGNIHIRIVGEVLRRKELTVLHTHGRSDIAVGNQQIIGTVFNQHIIHHAGGLYGDGHGKHLAFDTCSRSIGRHGVNLDCPADGRIAGARTEDVDVERLAVIESRKRIDAARISRPLRHYLGIVGRGSLGEEEVVILVEGGFHAIFVVCGVGQIDRKLLLHRDAVLQRRDRRVESVDGQSVLTCGNRRRNGEQVIGFGLREGDRHGPGFVIDAAVVVQAFDQQGEGPFAGGDIRRDIDLQHAAVGTRYGPCDTDCGRTVIHVGDLPRRTHGAGLHLHAERAAHARNPLRERADIVVDHEDFHLVLLRELHHVDHGRKGRKGVDRATRRPDEKAGLAQEGSQIVLARANGEGGVVVAQELEFVEIGGIGSVLNPLDGPREALFDLHLDHLVQILLADERDHGAGNGEEVAPVIGDGRVVVVLPRVADAVVEQGCTGILGFAFARSAGPAHAVDDALVAMVAAQDLAPSVLGHVEAVIGQLLPGVVGRIVLSVLIITCDHQVGGQGVVLHDDGNHIGEGVDLALDHLTFRFAGEHRGARHVYPCAIVDAAQLRPEGGSVRHVLMEVVAALAEIDQLDFLDDEVFGGVMPQVEAANAAPESDASRNRISRTAAARKREVAGRTQCVLHLAPHRQGDGAFADVVVAGVERRVEIRAHRFIVAVDGDMGEIFIESAKIVRDVLVRIADNERPIRGIGGDSLGNREREITRSDGHGGVLVGEIIAGLLEEEDMHVAHLALVGIGRDGPCGKVHIIDREIHPQLPGTDGVCGQLHPVPHAARKGGRGEQTPAEFAQPSAASFFHSILHNQSLLLFSGLY